MKLTDIVKKAKGLARKNRVSDSDDPTNRPTYQLTDKRPSEPLTDSRKRTLRKKKEGFDRERLERAKTSPPSSLLPLPPPPRSL